jgi:predicted dehydrogenase
MNYPVKRAVVPIVRVVTTAWSAQGTAQPPVRVGFIGAGSVVWAYLQMLDRLIPRGLAEEGPICSRRPEARERLLGRRPRAEIVADPMEVVESDVDLVAVLTSAESHAQLARLALEHGKHVLVEKPLASSRDEGAELAAFARERKLHLMPAPFVHLAPTFRALWTEVEEGAVGHVHTARGLYGVAPPDWNTWMYVVGPLVDLGIYNLKSLTALLGPVIEVIAAETRANATRRDADPADVIHLTIRHEQGALSSVIASWEIHGYRRPALELYGTEGTANLLGDDWDPRGYQLYRAEERAWREVDAVDPTWLWTDGLRELVEAVREDRDPLANVEQDLHLLEVLDAARRSAAGRASVTVTSRFEQVDLRLVGDPLRAGHIHDHTRPPEEQR